MVIVPIKRKRTRSKTRRQVTWNIRKGSCKGGGRSSKAKGRAAVVQVQEMLLKAFPHLNERDIFVKATTQGGCDIHLSQAASKAFPYDIEVKNVEKLSIWKMLAQAENNSTKTPISFFKRSRTPLFVAMKAEDFMELIRRKQ